MQRFLGFLLVILFILSSYLSAQDTLVFARKYLPSDNKTLVFVPDNDSAGVKRFPLLYLLHGWSGSSFDWNEHTKIQDYADKYGFFIVCPDGYYDSWYVESPLLENNKYRTFFINDLIPAIHSKYKIDSSYIFITGLSMGGQGAINLFIDNQNYFKSAGSMSGIMDITAFSDNWGMAKQLGDYKDNKEIWEKYSCVSNLKFIKDKKTPFLIDCGTGDIAYPVNIKLKEMAVKLGLNITFVSRPGNHNWEYWVESLPKHLDFFKSIIAGSN